MCSHFFLHTYFIAYFPKIQEDDLKSQISHYMRINDMFIIHYIFLFQECLFIGFYKIMTSLITRLFIIRKLKLYWVSLLEFMMLEKLHSPYHIHFLMWYWIFMDIGTCFHTKNISINSPQFFGNFKEYLCDT